MTPVGVALIVATCWLGLAPVYAQTSKPSAASHLIQVGPGKSIKTIAAAAASAKDGDLIEVEAGDYSGDVAVWSKNNLTLRAIGGRVRLKASGMAAEGKAIWVVRGGRMIVEGFDFSGARVSDTNGAGIRLESGKLTVRDCTFTDNQNGILTSNNPKIELAIENSEFGNNGHEDGRSHNLYAGEIARLTVTGSYFHHAKFGHLLKSRAAVNDIRYNRLTDELGGRASYELEFANGGIAYVVGNIIQQSSQTENPNIISYGAEGYKWPKNELYLVNNTLVDNRPQNGVFLRIKPGNVVVRAVNNLLIGKGRLDSAAPGDYRNNFNVDWDQFELAAREDYRLKRNASVFGSAIDAGTANGQTLMPNREYRHPRNTIGLASAVRHPGALQSLK
jgi:Right handed beta helix region